LIDSCYSEHYIELLSRGFFLFDVNDSNHGKNTTCVVTAEGSLHVIDMPAPSDVALERLSGTEPIPDLPYIVDHHEVSVAIPMNVARILIADITGDSQNEIVLARTDRQVHSFRLGLIQTPFLFD